MAGFPSLPVFSRFTFSVSFWVFAAVVTKNEDGMILQSAAHLGCKKLYLKKFPVRGTKEKRCNLHFKLSVLKMTAGYLSPEIHTYCMKV